MLQAIDKKLQRLLSLNDYPHQPISRQRKAMIIRLADNSEIDTERDLISAEKHILQKLLCYKVYVGSIAEFRQKKAAAFQIGWSDSGPVNESTVMARVAEQLEAELRLRLQEQTGQ
jgi:hypothetical protein